MRIGTISGPAASPRSRNARPERYEPEAVECRALIALEAPVAAERIHTMTRHPAAPFLAQLIATQMQAPQTRARRRAEPEDAMAAYGARNARHPVAGQKRFS